ATLDGNLWRDSPSVPKERFWGEAQAGFALTYEDWRISYTYAARTRQFEGQDEGHRFGGVSVSYRY
ncbi:MAG: lipid A-modifier LpxR family protein, partial [Pseudomonadota bacterium]